MQNCDATRIVNRKIGVNTPQEKLSFLYAIDCE